MTSPTAEARPALGRVVDPDLSFEDYLADPCPRPSLSSSLATTLVTRSPLHAWQAHPKLGGGVEDKPSKAKVSGTLIHSLLLGAGPTIRVVRSPTWRTKEAKRERALAQVRGETAVLAKHHDAASAAAEKIRVGLADRGVTFAGGHRELTIMYEVETPAGAVWARTRLDFFDGARQIVDLKSTRSAHPRDVARAVDQYGYDTQSAAYVQAVETVWPELAGRVEYVLAFVELKPPYAVFCAPLDGTFEERGRRRWSSALTTFAHCLNEDHWPGYPPDARIWAPGYVLAQLDEEKER